MVWAKKTKLNVLDKLGQLELYSDVVVIQKKFFEKTSRWELGLSGMTSLNNKFFTSVGLNGSLGHHISERWAIEGRFWFSNLTERDFTKNLEEKYAIKTADVVTPEGFAGLSIVWTPIYGKLSLFERTINPFELFFTLGGGVIFTDDKQSVPAASFSFGQIHPLNTYSTVRWEVGGNIFQAQPKEHIQEEFRGDKILSEIFYISFGISLFFPRRK